MYRFSALASAVVFTTCLFSGCAELQSMMGTDALVSLLTNQLNVTANQAKGGLGSMLSLAKEKLSGADFSSLTKYIPGSDTYMQVSKDLGAVTGPINDQAGLQTAFSRLGMGSDMVGKFWGVLSDFVGKAGGEPAKNLLAALVQ